MNNKKVLIEKFISNSCTKEELEELLLMISQENTEDLSEILKTNWENPINKNKNDNGIDWDANFSSMMENAKFEAPVISTQQNSFEEPGLSSENSNRKSRIYRIMIRTAAAASLIFAVVMGMKMFSNDNSGKTIANNQKNTVIKADTMMVVMLHEENKTDNIKAINLPDGSLINLYTNSELTYRENAERNRRDVVLIGKADFKVAKDKTRPFSVFSGDISTTALGTQFTVTAIPKDKEIRVRLYEGRVVVKSTKVKLKNIMRDVYLTPGLELVYNIIRHTATVNSFTVLAKNLRKDIKEKESVSEDPEVPKYDNRSWIMFNNQPLDEIFKELGDVYNVRISYLKKDIDKMYFIGTFAKSDSVEYILKQIANINNLSITKDNNTFIIKKNVAK